MSTGYKIKTARSPELTTITGLLGSDAPEKRSAAAIVIAELAPDDPEVLEAVRLASRREDDAPLRRHAVRAIGAMAPKTIVRDLQPLLHDSDRQVRAAVREVLASGKGVKEADIAKMLDSQDERERLAAIAVLGAMGTGSARKRLLVALKGASSRESSAIVDALRPGLVEAEGKTAEKAVEQIDAAADTDAVVADPDFALAIIQLLGHAGTKGASSVLVRVATTSKATEDVRVSSLETLQRLVRGRGHDEHYRQLLEVVEDKGAPDGVRSASVNVLSNLDVPMQLEARVRGFTASEGAAERRWALRALGTLDTAPAAEALAKVVEEGAPADREVALESAVKMPRGRQALARLLGRLTDVDRASQVARGLRSQPEALSPDIKHALEQAVMEAPPEIGKIILDVLKSGGGAARVQESLLDKAGVLKNNRKYDEAISMLRSLAQVQDDPEIGFQLAVCELKISKRKIVRGATNNDRCLTTFGNLLKHRDFQVLDRLKEEKILEPDDLYYLGFSLAERGGPEQALGGDILTYLVESELDPKLGQMARNKLVTMGWLE